MRTQVSVIALATALLASSPAMAQISLGGDGLGVSVGGDSGVNVNIGAGSDGLNVDAGVGGSDGLNVGAGVDANDGLNVDAGVGLGGSDGLNVDAGVGVGGSNELVDVDVDAGVGGANGINADVDAEIGGGGVGPNGGRLINLGSQGDLLDVDVGGENGGTRVGIAALDEAARVEALIGRIGDPQLADVDLDAVVDDQRVSIVALADLLNGESLAEVEAAIDLNSDGRAELLDAVGASEVLTSILGREGIAIEDVLSVSVNDDGATEIVVLGGGEGSDGESEGLLGGVAGLTETELAELDVDLLSDEELAEVDLALLPQEEQRVDAVLRLLSTGGAADDESGSDGTTRVVDLSVLLGEDALAIVDEALGDTVPEVDAELTAQLEALGIDPEAVVALGTDAGGNQRVFLNTAVLLPGGEDAGGDAGGGSAGGGSGSGSGSGGSDGDTDSTAGSGGGSTGGGDSDNTGGSSGGTGDSGGNGDNSGGTGGTGGGAGGTGDDAGGTGSGNGNSDGSSGGAETGIDSDTDLDIEADGAVGTGGAGAVAGTGDAGLELVATLDCEVGGAALSQGASASPAAIAQASSLELVRVVGCDQTLASDDIERVRDALESNAAITEAIDSVGLSLEQVIGATVSGEVVTVFLEQPVA